MSSGPSSQPGAAPPNEDWLSHRMNFLPLPLIITNLLPGTSKPMSKDTPTTSSLIAPEQCHWPPAQPLKQQAERRIAPTDIVDTTTETRQPRCFSLPGPDVLKERLRNPKWSQASLPSLRDKFSHTRKSRSNSVESLQPVSTATPTTPKSSESRPPRFLGRYSPPFQQRSTSLPRVLERRPSHPTMPERQLLLGGRYDRTRPGYQKIPRFVPTEIRRETTFDVSSISISDIDGDTRCPQEVQTRAFGNHSLEFTLPKEEMDSRRATRATSEIFPPGENTPITKPDEQDAENKLVRKKIQTRTSKFCQYVWRWLRKHRDGGGCDRVENSAVTGQTAGPVLMGAVETNS